MNPFTRRLIAGVVVAVVMAGLSAVPEAVIDSRPECERANEWVASNRESLPTDADTFSAFPVTYRRAIVGALKPETRYSIVVSKLTELARTQELNTAQRGTVEDLLGNLTVESFVTPATETTKLFAKTWQTKLAAVFRQDQFEDYFLRLGMPDEGRLTRDTWRILVTRTFSDYGRLFAIPQCACDSTSLAACGGPTAPKVCCCTGVQCVPQPTGCGLFLVWPCDGLCMFGPCPY